MFSFFGVDLNCAACTIRQGLEITYSDKEVELLGRIRKCFIESFGVENLRPDSRLLVDALSRKPVNPFPDFDSFDGSYLRRATWLQEVDQPQDLLSLVTIFTDRIAKYQAARRQSEARSFHPNNPESLLLEELRVWCLVTFVSSNPSGSSVVDASLVVDPKKPVSILKRAGENTAVSAENPTHATSVEGRQRGHGEPAGWLELDPTEDQIARGAAFLAKLLEGMGTAGPAPAKTTHKLLAASLLGAGGGKSTNSGRSTVDGKGEGGCDRERVSETGGSRGCDGCRGGGYGVQEVWWPVSTGGQSRGASSSLAPLPTLLASLRSDLVRCVSRRVRKRAEACLGLRPLLRALSAHARHCVSAGRACLAFLLLAREVREVEAGSPQVELRGAGSKSHGDSACHDDDDDDDEEEAVSDGVDLNQEVESVDDDEDNDEGEGVVQEGDTNDDNGGDDNEEVNGEEGGGSGGDKDEVGSRPARRAAAEVASAALSTGQKKFDLASPTAVGAESRVGSKYQAVVTPFQGTGSSTDLLFPAMPAHSSSSSSSSLSSSSAATAAAAAAAGNAEEGLEVEQQEVVWSDADLPPGFDLAAFLAKCKGIRDPTAGTILRLWNTQMGKCQWCVFLRMLPPDDSDDDDDSDAVNEELGDEDGGDGKSPSPTAAAAESAAQMAGDDEQTSTSTSTSTSSKASRMARVVAGERQVLKAQDVKLDSLIGWSNEPDALDALFKAHFDPELALKAMQESYDATGYFRDKFVSWEGAEAELVCDAAARHHDDLHYLCKEVLSTDKSSKEIIEFFDHMLRSGGDHGVVTRLFATAEFSRAAKGAESEVSEEFLKGQGQLAGEDKEQVALRKSKRERRAQGHKSNRLLPGEKESDDEFEGGSGDGGGGGGRRYLQAKSPRNNSCAAGGGCGSGSGGGSGGNGHGTRGGGVVPNSSSSSSPRAGNGTGSSASSSSGPGRPQGSTPQNGGGGGGKRARVGNGYGSTGGGGASGWFKEHQEQYNVVAPRQQELLQSSFTFLHAAQGCLEQEVFFKLVKRLVDFDKGAVEVPALVQAAAECLGPHEELAELFKAFLPDKAKPMLSKLIRSNAAKAGKGSGVR